jgi:hypothetical protein
MHDGSQLTSGLVGLAVLALIVFRTLRTQTVRVWALIATPVLLLGVACMAVAATPPKSAVGVLVIAIGVIAGAALGYARGIHSNVRLGPRPGTLVVQGNLVLVGILVAAVAVRFIVRAALGTRGPLSLALSDALLLFAAASVAVARGILFFTWRRLSGAERAPARES